MAAGDSERERWRLAQLYGAMGDGELEKLADDAGSLSETARRALQFEIAKRGLEFGLRHASAAAAEPVFSKLVTIRQFRDVPHAYLAKGLLDSAGIESFLFDEHIVRMDWLISNFVGGVKLRVREEDAAEALELLDAAKAENGEPEKVEDPPALPERCPNCRSTDVAYQPLMKRLAYLSVLLGFPIPAKHVAWKCGFCGHVWGDAANGENRGRS